MSENSADEAEVLRQEIEQTRAELAETVDARARTAALAGVLAGLAPGDRDVLLLVAWAGLSTDEVARALDLPPGTVKSRLSRARRRLGEEYRALAALPEGAGS